MKWIQFNDTLWQLDSNTFPALLRQSKAFMNSPEWVLSVPCLDMNLLLGSVGSLTLEEAQKLAQDRVLERLALIKEVWE